MSLGGPLILSRAEPRNGAGSVGSKLRWSRNASSGLPRPFRCGIEGEVSRGG
jgi:hypothetical protein